MNIYHLKSKWQARMALQVWNMLMRHLQSQTKCYWTIKSKTYFLGTETIPNNFPFKQMMSMWSETVIQFQLLNRRIKNADSVSPLVLMTWKTLMVCQHFEKAAIMILTTIHKTPKMSQEYKKHRLNLQYTQWQNSHAAGLCQCLPFRFHLF